MTFCKGTKTIQRRKPSFSTSGSGKLDNSTSKKTKKHLKQTIYLISKLVIQNGYRVNYKIVKILEK